jgi:hypothetical protein
MTKRLHTTEMIGGQGVFVMNNDSTNTVWSGNENVEIVKTTTNIQLDTAFLNMQMNNHLMMAGPKFIEDTLQRLIKEKIHFDMVSWINDDGIPEVTCQLFYGDKLIDEKTTHITDGKKELVASPAA